MPGTGSRSSAFFQRLCTLKSIEALSVDNWLFGSYNFNRYMKDIFYIFDCEEVRGMNLTVFADSGDVFMNCECIKGYTFKMAVPRGKSTHLTAVSALLQDQSAHTAVLNASYRMHAS